MSIGQLFGKAKWEKPLADWIVAAGVGLLGHGKQDYEAERVERNDGWRPEPFVSQEFGSSTRMKDIDLNLFSL
jgi:hypothetical protein